MRQKGKFRKYWQVETEKALQELITTEALKKDKAEEIINNFLFTRRMTTEDKVI